MGKSAAGAAATVQVAVATTTAVKPAPSGKAEVDKRSLSKTAKGTKSTKKGMPKKIDSSDVTSSKDENENARKPVRTESKKTADLNNNTTVRLPVTKRTGEQPKRKKTTTASGEVTEENKKKTAKKMKTAVEEMAAPTAKKTKKGGAGAVVARESPRSDATTQVSESVAVAHSQESDNMSSSSISGTQTVDNSVSDLLGFKISVVSSTEDERLCTVQDLFDIAHDIDSIAFVIFPKANTPGCTKQCIGFSENREAFAQLGVALVGLSTDSLQSQRTFINEHDLNIPIIAKGTDLLKSLNSISNEGKTIRSVVAVDRHGNMFYEKHKVSPDKCVNELLRYLRERDEPPTEIVSEKETTSKESVGLKESIGSKESVGSKKKKQTTGKSDKGATDNAKKTASATTNEGAAAKKKSRKKLTS